MKEKDTSNFQLHPALHVFRLAFIKTELADLQPESSHQTQGIFLAQVCVTSLANHLVDISKKRKNKVEEKWQWALSQNLK